MLRSSVFLVGLCLACPVFATVQDPAEIRRSVDEFLQKHVQTLPGTSTYSIGRIEASQNRPACAKLSAVLAPNARAYGKTTALVRCEGGWTMYVTVQINVTAAYLTSTRPISQGQTLSAEDIQTQTGKL